MIIMKKVLLCIMDGVGLTKEKKYNALSEDQQKAVRMIYPQKISEAVPKDYGGKK